MAIQTTTLSNGFQIMTDFVPTMESCMVGLYVRSGVRHERPDEHGAAHFLEHMLFKKTERRRGEMQIMKEIEGVGGDMNAFTTYERTFYHIQILDEHIPLAAEMLADMARNSLLDQDDIETERDVIIQELAMKNDDPQRMTYVHYQESAYPGQTMGNSALGTKANLESMTRESLMNFWKRMYTPERMTLGIVGNADHAEMVKIANSLFGDMEPGNARKDARAEFLKDNPEHRCDHRILNESLDQVQMVVGFDCKHAPIEDAAIAKVHSAIMGGMMTSRLSANARERGLCYSIFSHVVLRTDHANYIVDTSTTPDNAVALAKAIFDEFRKTAKKVEHHEISKMREISKHSIIRESEDCEQRLLYNLESMHFYGKTISKEERIAIFNSITAYDVEEFGRRMLDESPCLMIRYGPDSPALSIDDLVQS